MWRDSRSPTCRPSSSTGPLSQARSLTRLSIRDGAVRNIGHLRTDLIGYHKNKMWEQVKPVSGHLAPYSQVGNFLAAIGSFGSALLVPPGLQVIAWLIPICL